MADYRDLLRKAVGALPENNGAARRGVYEKARNALVAQLRAITPPLPAREITQHRLQLEDCIRQVEQEATEQLLNAPRQGREDGRDDSNETDEMAVPPAAAPPEPEPEPVTAPIPEPVAEPKPEPVAVAPEPETPIEAEAKPEPEPEAAAPTPPAPDPEPEPPKDISAPIQAAPPRPVSQGNVSTPQFRSTQPPPRSSLPSSSLPVSGSAALATSAVAKPSSIDEIIARAEAASRREPVETPRPAPVSPPRPVPAPTPVARRSETPRPDFGPAMSRVREVEVEPPPDQREANDPQLAIDRAIETLDREARGEAAPPPPIALATVVDREDPVQPYGQSETRYAPPPAFSTAYGAEPELEPEPRGGNGLTIFLLLFVLLLGGAAGGGYWAWREDFIDLEAMFGQAETPVVDPVAEPNPVVGASGGAEEEPAVEAANDAAVPGNTAAAPEPSPDPLAVADDPVLPFADPQAPDERLLPEDTAIVEPDVDIVADLPEEINTPDSAEVSQERLTPEDDAGIQSAEEQTAALAAGESLADAAASSQSLLLEASADGATGAVPFSGTVSWARGEDETGLPTIIGTANIPARNLDVRILLRRNADPTLPASHLMEIDFTVADTFVGGGIRDLPGVLLKNEELVQGTPLIGASARIVGNSFLFALSSAGQDVSTNTNLLESRRWLDLAMVYATGRRAIITLEKDDEAQALFETVLAEWRGETP